MLLGSTGSIGTQAIDIVRANPDAFRVVAIAAGGDRPELLAAQALELGVEAVAVARASAAEDVQLALYAEAQRRGYDRGEFPLPKLLAGPDAATEAAAWPSADVVVNGMTGSIGLAPTLEPVVAAAPLPVPRFGIATHAATVNGWSRSKSPTLGRITVAPGRRVYAGTPFRLSAYVPTEGKQVIRERYGDCKDKAALLTALLSAVGIKANMALLSGRRHGVTPFLPSPRFAHAIALSLNDQPIGLQRPVQLPSAFQQSGQGELDGRQ